MVNININVMLCNRGFKINCRGLNQQACISSWFGNAGLQEYGLSECVFHDSAWKSVTGPMVTSTMGWITQSNAAPFHVCQLAASLREPPWIPESASWLPYTPGRGTLDRETENSSQKLHCTASAVCSCHSGKPCSLWKDYTTAWIPEKGALQGTSWRLPNTVMLNKTGQLPTLVELAPLEGRGEDDNKPVSKYTDAFGSFKGNEENQT